MRGRKPVAGTGPLVTFATQLREVMDGAPEKLSYRIMAEKVDVGYNALADAARGHKLPSLKVTRAFITACGGTEKDLKQWSIYWNDTRRALRAQMPKTQQDKLGYCRPTPEAVETFEELNYQLRVLLIMAGSPKPQELVAKVEKHAREAYDLSTLSDILTGTQPPGWKSFKAIVSTLLHLCDVPDRPWTDYDKWADAWRRAEFNRERPDLKRPHRDGNSHLSTDDKHRAITAEVIARMNTGTAAVVLAGLDRAVAAEILSHLTVKRARDVVMAMRAIEMRILTSRDMPGRQPQRTGSR